MTRSVVVIALSAIFAGPAFAQTINFGIDENGQPAEPSGRGTVTPIAGEVVPGDSYFIYTSDESTCNGDGTMTVDSDAGWAQLEGHIQTSDRNVAEHGGGGEQIIRGPGGQSIVEESGWNGFGDWNLEADDTGFETVRGRDGATLGDPLIYEITVNYDCSGATAGDPAVRTYEFFHRGISPEPQSVPTLSSISLMLLSLLAFGLGMATILRR